MAINVSITAYCTECGYDVTEVSDENVTEAVVSMDEVLESSILVHYRESPECEPEDDYDE